MCPVIFNAIARDEFYFVPDHTLQNFKIFTCSFEHERKACSGGYLWLWELRRQIRIMHFAILDH